MQELDKLLSESERVHNHTVNVNKKRTGAQSAENEVQGKVFGRVVKSNTR